MANNDDKEQLSKQKIAVALKYEEGRDIAPKVISTGKGLIADLILELAREKGIPSYQDKELAELLSKIEVDTTIPLEAYNTVAQILAFVYKASREKLAKRNKS
ncbi:MAG: putative flhb domain protein [Rickettsiaceae bacterium]|jgi:flagellar biosynthesis protein|nr:putative flhb domain protein [Rickettsiaceae bacterium]